MIRKFLSWPIRVHLLLLVILLALPSITLIIYWGLDARDQAIEAADDECQKFVNSVAAEQQATVAGVQQLLVALALLPDVKARNVPATDYLLSDLQKKNPLYSVIVISDKSGLIWASSTPLEEKISAVGRRYFEEAVRSGVFSSGEYSVGRIAKKPVMTFAQPVTNTSNELTNVIAVSLKLDHFQFLFEKINLPEGSSFSLLDHKGVILHRNSQDPLSEQLVGKRDSREELFTKMAEGPDEGTYEAIGNDGKVRLIAYKKLRLPHESQPYLYIRSSILKSSVISKANTTMFRNMAALILVFAVGLILAAFIGRRLIVDPITKLKEASRQLAADPTPVNISEKVKDGELGELAQAFDDMAESLLLKEKEQLAAEEELRQTHARAKWLARLPEENPNPVLRVSNDGDSQYCNPASMELDGWKCEEGLPMPSPILPLVRKAITEDRELMQDVDLGGKTYWVAVTPFPEEGYANVYGQDITERKRAEVKLQTTLQRFYTLLSGMHSSILLVADDGRVEYANQAFCDYVEFQCSPADLRQLSSHEVIERIRNVFLNPDEAVTRIMEILAKGQPVISEEVAARGGRTYLRDFIPLYVDGKSYGRLWHHWDITERKQMEEALRKAKDELEERVKERTYELYAESLYARSLIEASLDPLVTISVEGKITDVNRATEEVTGASREQLIGTDFSDYFTEPEKARAGYVEVFRQGFVRDYSLELKHRDGQVTPVLYNASVYRDETGQIMGVFAAARDITERRQAEAALRKLASELVMAEERERKRIAGVLHDEVAQTLAAARMRIDLLKGAPPSDQKQTLKEAKALLLQSIQETRSLMNDLGNPLLFDMGVKAACESHAGRLMETHSVRIVCDIKDAFKYVNPDVKTILYQLIRELLANVVKHSQARNARVMIDMENGHFRVKVTDDGVGFDPERLGAPTVEGGFGLYSIRERLIAIDGRLRIESAPGSGTIVTAILPEALD